MEILINESTKADVKEEHLIIKDRKLFNKKTNKFEGLDGDLVQFIVKESDVSIKMAGTVDGYTHDGMVKLRGKDTIYHLKEDAKLMITNLSVAD